MISNAWKTSILLSWFLIAMHQRHRKPPKRRVCVIGAGVAGLISAKQLSTYPDEFETIVFEKQADVGGLWIYSEPDEFGSDVHSSIYKNVRTNSPKEVFMIPDYTQFWSEYKDSYVTQSDVLRCLQSYAEHFSLRQFIQFETVVEKVSSLADLRWLVKTRNLKNQEENELEFDAIIIGNGHASKENIPNIPGLESFSGRLLHSHVYREPHEFSGQTVVILGASFSGLDIGIEISTHAKIVYLSHRNDKLSCELPENMLQVAAVVRIENNDLILSDNSCIKAHTLILCTGYIYDFPFLDDDCGIVVENGKYVRPMYKHLINIERPTMAILNLPYPSIPIMMPHPQVNYFIATLRGKLKLPSREDMLTDSQLPESKPKDKAHCMLDEVFTYYDELAMACNVVQLPKYVKPVYLHIYKLFLSDPIHFRDKNLYVRSVNDEYFELR